VPETPTTTPPTTIVFPAGRYGRRRSGRRTPRWQVAIGAALVAAVAAVIGVSLYRSYGDGDYSASVTGYEANDSSIVITFLVRLPEGHAGRCVLRARDANGVETGKEEILVVPGPNPDRTVASHRLATRARAVTGEVQGCHPA
jgi:hypothetical protein